jgi:hypothetical protein
VLFEDLAMKTRISAFLLIVLLMPSLVSAQATKATRTPPKTADELREECKKFVQDFFDWYVPKASADVSQQGSTAEALALKKHPDDFSRALKYALTGDASASAKSTEVVGLDGDPFLNCQDCPKKVKFGEPKLTGYKCQVSLYFMQDNVQEEKPHVTAEAMYTQKRWVFTNFLDPDGGEDLLTTLQKLKADRSKPQ